MLVLRFRKHPYGASRKEDAAPACFDIAFRLPRGPILNIRGVPFGSGLPRHESNCSLHRPLRTGFVSAVATCSSPAAQRSVCPEIRLSPGGSRSGLAGISLVRCGPTHRILLIPETVHRSASGQELNRVAVPSAQETAAFQDRRTRPRGFRARRAVPVQREQGLEARRGIRIPLCLRGRNLRPTVPQSPGRPAASSCRAAACPTRSRT